MKNTTICIAYYKLHINIILMSSYPFSYRLRLEFLVIFKFLLVEPALLKILFDKWFCPEFYDVCNELSYPNDHPFNIHLDIMKIFDDIIRWNMEKHYSIQYGLDSNDSDFLLKMIALRTSRVQNSVIKLSRETFIYKKDNFKNLLHFKQAYLLFEIDQTICFINNEGDIIWFGDIDKFNFGKCYVSFQNQFFRW